MALMTVHRKPFRLLTLVAVCLVTSYYSLYTRLPPHQNKWHPPEAEYVRSSYDWRSRPEKFPVPESSMAHLPLGEPHELRRVQHDFSQDERDSEHEALQANRRRAVENAFRKCWESYREYAWGYDELMPERLRGADTFSGWGATLVDALDTLWIMDMRDEFHEAARAVGTIDWDNSTSRGCSLFETNIRYLGGLLSAYELSGERPLLDKAAELADMLYAAFDTANRMPVNSFDFSRARESLLVPNDREVSASVGTLSLEFTKLAQFTGQTRFYDAVDRIKGELARTQDGTKLPGMWPTFINLQNGFLTPDNTFTIGALADSLYEYLLKMHILLGGMDETYETMYKKAMETVRRHLLFRPMTPGEEDILFTGTASVKGPKRVELYPESQHLGCFAGGMFALGGKIFDLPEHVAAGEKLARGCAWAYAALPTGVMPEVAEMAACDGGDSGIGGSDDDDTPVDLRPPCAWNETLWRDSVRAKSRTCPPGFTAIRDARYLLRPEAIESLFVLYRITGNRDLQDAAWAMFTAVRRATETRLAHSAIVDVTVSGATRKSDSMESFWLAETLKYFYLIFSEPDYMSLDDFVFNTEAHPFRIPKPGAKPAS